MLAMLLLDLSTTTHLHVLHQELQPQQRRREAPGPSSSHDEPRNGSAADDHRDDGGEDHQALVQVMAMTRENGDFDEDLTFLMQNVQGPELPDERVAEFEEDLRWRIVRARRQSPGQVSPFTLCCYLCQRDAKQTLWSETAGPALV